ncbi:hypothetical protein LINGRAHAP2_LOCUS24562 [Linum grandiflorum]
MGIAAIFSSPLEASDKVTSYPLFSFPFALRYHHDSSIKQLTQVLSGVKISRHSPSISHLFFADGCFIFLEASKDSASHLKVLLDKYQFLSGQKINLQSSIYFSTNAPQDLQSKIASFLGVGSLGYQDRYLGISSLIPRSKRDMFQYLEDKILTKIAG